jgi:hypothetical protein
MSKQLLGVFLVSMLVACGGTTDPEFETTLNESSREEVSAETPEVERDAQVIAYCSPYYYEILYYADCTRGTIVGIESVTCKGERYLDGTKTQYYEATRLDYCPRCNISPMRPTSCQ